MTTIECLAAIKTLLVELKNRIKDRGDAAAYQQIYTLYSQFEDKHRKEKEEADARHAQAIAKKDEKIATLEAEILDIKKRIHDESTGGPRFTYDVRNDNNDRLE